MNEVGSTTGYYNARKNGSITSSGEWRMQNATLQEDLKLSMMNKQHLANVICGINHEISPWLGNVSNIVARLESSIAKLEEEFPEGTVDPKISAFRDKLKDKLKDIKMACEQSSSILMVLSRNVKKVQTYSVGEYNVKETIGSWANMILMDRVLKADITANNFDIDLKSLDFVAMHSPMLLTQVILNLAKNSVDHNQHMLDTLKLKIAGYDKCLVFSDNGKGIPEDMIDTLFEPGITTKIGDDKGQHGFGLSACMDYCISMGAMMWVESDGHSFTRFIINFDFENYKSELKKLHNTERFQELKVKKCFLLNEDIGTIPE
jgi:signal transduction histidine kinase